MSGAAGSEGTSESCLESSGIWGTGVSGHGLPANDRSGVRDGGTKAERVAPTFVTGCSSDGSLVWGVAVAGMILGEEVRSGGAVVSGFCDSAPKVAFGGGIDS